MAIFAAAKALGDALASEVMRFATSHTSELLSLFSDLECTMKIIKSELQVMQAFLDEINTHDHNNRTLEVWLVEVRNLAYHIQDIMDEFTYLSNNKENGGIGFYVKRLFKKNPLLPYKQIASQLQAAEKSLKNLSEMQNRWVSNTIGLVKNPHYSIKCSQHAAISTHFIDEDELVGVEENRALLTNWLNSEELNLSVISVWGMGGLGKTALVTNILEREKNKYDCHAWVSISQTYTVDHILRNMISEICESDKRISIKTTTMDIRKLKETLRKILKEKRYLIVLDDTWDPMVFRDISDALINNHKGSRVVITSRIAEVAFLAPESHRLKLRPLKDDESWELFCRNAFQHERNHESHPHLEKWAREIVFKCKGLPLALVSIGSMLALHETSEVEWKRVHDQLSWELENNPKFDNMRNILNLSFSYLPRNLKNCFLYCCMFPEDHLLARKKIIRLWIAEGFIEERGASTLEEVAEGYLIQLIRRSMLQLVKTNYFGRVKRCRMHDALRELGLSLCVKENFGLTHKYNKFVKIHTSVRRLFVCNDHITHNSEVSQLRTFLSFDSRLSSSMLCSIILNSRYLTILDLEGSPIEILPDTIGDLFNLRYLGLRRTKVKFLAKSIEKLSNLQTLDVIFSEIQKIPDGIAKLTKLRHIFAELQLDETNLSFRSTSGIGLSKGITNLKDLQTLQALEASSEVVKEIGNLTQLRSFRILNVKESYSADLCTSLSKMPILSYLDIKASSENEFIQLEHLNPPPSQLQKLFLTGRLKENTFASPLFQKSGKNLQNLYLSWSRLQNDPLPSLSHLSNLMYMYINRAYEGQQLVFRDGWFPKLKYLCLTQLPSLVKLGVEKGAMISVEIIYLYHMKQLVEVPKGIEHLTSLKFLGCEGLSPDFGGFVNGHNDVWHFTCYVEP